MFPFRSCLHCLAPILIGCALFGLSASSTCASRAKEEHGVKARTLSLEHLLFFMARQQEESFGEIVSLAGHGDGSHLEVAIFFLLIFWAVVGMAERFFCCHFVIGVLLSALFIVRVLLIFKDGPAT
jgi:hypothetical protein